VGLIKLRKNIGMRKFNKSIFILLAWLITAQFCGSFVLAANQNPHKLFVGWATKSITPDKPVALDGQFRTRISREHMDSVTCTAMAIETRAGSNSIETAIMVSCDLVAIREGLLDEVKKVLKPQLPDFDLNKLWLNATHTHTAPVLSLKVINYNYDIPEDAIKPSEYMQFAAERIAKAAVEAWNSRKPAGMSWGLGQAVVGFNRRAVYFEPVPSGFGKGTAVMYGKTNREDFSSIEGYEDHGLEMMFFWDEQKKLTGMVLNIACPAQDTEGLSQLSADFWNEARAELHKRYGDDVYIFPQTSAAGDISPHLLWRKEAEMEMLKRKGISHRQEIGIRIANAVDDVFPYVQKDIKTEVVFNHFTGDVDLPVRKVTKEEVEQAKMLIKKNPEKTRFHNKIIVRYNKQDRNPIYSAPVHVMRLGDVAIATNPFELFLDFGIRIKTQSKAIITFLVQHSGRGHYVPTVKAEAGGGYSAIVQSNPVGSDGGQVLVEKTLEQINKMWE
jgi:hypothetical protein